MTQAPAIPLHLTAHALRTLSLDPRTHPRAQAHLSAASGLVCAHGRAYVIADDEHHLAVFRDLHSPGTLHRILAGDLPVSKKARKQLKPDMESLLLLPGVPGALVAFGSGSRPNRDNGVLIPLSAQGEPAARVLRFDLKPMYEPLRAALGEINIEGALLLGDELVLLNRGVAGQSDNAAAHYRLSALLAVIEGRRHKVRPRSIRPYQLGALDGVALGFTDGTALPGGGWVFCAVAENTADSYADGPCSGAVLGVVDAHGEVVAVHRLATPQRAAIKVEGVAVRQHQAGLDICLVTDADDPRLSSQLLLTRL
ncbi:MAG: hypothetical protein H7Y33_03265 [Cytophagales bacterium]|nr:hypothetical protein [Rhizobacter sp.]